MQRLGQARSTALYERGHRRHGRRQQRGRLCRCDGQSRGAAAPASRHGHRHARRRADQDGKTSSCTVTSRASAEVPSSRRSRSAARRFIVVTMQPTLRVTPWRRTRSASTCSRKTASHPAGEARNASVTSRSTTVNKDVARSVVTRRHGRHPRLWQRRSRRGESRPTRDRVVPAAPGWRTGTGHDERATGQCVIEVKRSEPGRHGDDAARGTHTIVIKASDDLGDAWTSDEVTIEIQVGGAPATIESDAPERIDPSDRAHGQRHRPRRRGRARGCVTIESIQTAGDGAIITAIGRRPATVVRSSRTSHRPRRAWLSSSYGRSPPAGTAPR